MFLKPLGDLIENLKFTTCGGQSYKKHTQNIQSSLFLSYDKRTFSNKVSKENEYH